VSKEMSDDKIFLMEMTTQITAARVAETDLTAKEIGRLYKDIFIALEQIADIPSAGHNTPEPAVPIDESIQPDYLVCLEDGKKMKMMRRYLRTSYNMTPEEYREKWDLPADYPMTAPNYAKKRSSLAKDIGLGKTSSRKKSKK